MEVTFRSNDRDGSTVCQMGSQELAEGLSNEAITVPDVNSFAAATVAEPLIDSGAPMLTGSVMAVLISTLFAVYMVFF